MTTMIAPQTLIDPKSALALPAEKPQVNSEEVDLEFSFEAEVSALLTPKTDNDMIDVDLVEELPPKHEPEQEPEIWGLVQDPAMIILQPQQHVSAQQQTETAPLEEEDAPELNARPLRQEAIAPKQQERTTSSDAKPAHTELAEGPLPQKNSTPQTQSFLQEATVELQDDLLPLKTKAPDQQTSGVAALPFPQKSTLAAQALYHPVQLDQTGAPHMKDNPSLHYAFSVQTNAAGDQHLKIHLLPPEMGHIKVDLKIDGTTGEKSVSFIFSQSSTYDLFKDNNGALQQMLHKAGYDVAPDAVTMTYQGREMQENLQQFFAQHQQHERSQNQNSDEDSEEIDEPLMVLNGLLNVEA